MWARGQTCLIRDIAIDRLGNEATMYQCLCVVHLDMGVRNEAVTWSVAMKAAVTGKAQRPSHINNADLYSVLRGQFAQQDYAVPNEDQHMCIRTSGAKAT